MVGRGIGLATGSGQSASNRALRTVRGAFAGQQIGRRTSNRQAFEYTVLIGGTSTVTMITDEAGMRVGDCIAVERGSFNNPPGRGWQTRMNNALLQSIGAAKTRRARQE